MIEKVSLGTDRFSEDHRDIRELLDRILDKGLVLDPATRLTMTEPGASNRRLWLAIDGVGRRKKADR